ncbi:hypothetical protein [Candidatus Chloroploca sp. Khr17]|uniref:hypothetical protein n=1 Tax=Candidatus Chloroploca sp. Khr17 TaxID=2496869 RepID=UPI00101B8F28|nr:hypothetical protein [Candidatus Chloroploca sp. Khr17]
MNKRYYYQELGISQANLWSELLKYVLPQATEVEFAIGGVNDNLSVRLAEYSDLLVERHVDQIRWNFKQIGVSTFFKFRLAPNLKIFIASINKLGMWIDDLPEDPTFYHDKKKILWTISHSESIFWLLSSEEAQGLNQRGFSLSPIPSPISLDTG